MLRLVTINGERITPRLVKPDPYDDPQSMLDMFCVLCFRHRRHYLVNISDVEPFDKKRAGQVMDTMLEKGLYDPKAYALGDVIRRNWWRFTGLE